jgi:acyl-coenzyme A thioesterase PaaI-like protein
MPEGYSYEPTPAPFLEHVGKVYMKDVTRPDGTVEKWSAIRVEPHQVNAWNFAHGGLLATMAEVGTARASWEPGAPACVAVDLSIQFIGAPKLGDIIEVCGTITKRTRSMIFTSARGEVDGKPVLFATSIQKIVGE